MYPPVYTKWGIANVRDDYYCIGSKKLHRLIYEDNKKCTLLPKTHIHHINGNKLDNSIENLIALTPTEHRNQHKKLNKQLRKQEREKPHEIVDKDYPKISIDPYGKYVYIWKFNTIHKKIPQFGYVEDTDIEQLKRKVLAQGLTWIE